MNESAPAAARPRHRTHTGAGRVHQITVSASPPPAPRALPATPAVLPEVVYVAAREGPGGARL